MIISYQKTKNWRVIIDNWERNEKKTGKIIQMREKEKSFMF